uniref:DUF4360 domain-containing protein n=1 Tax=Candidatus Electronema sp. TaxID=2698783 RepID=UPI0040579529
AAALTAAGFAVTEAAAQVYFNAPVKFAGTGCGAGSYTVSGEGTDTLTVLFSVYDAALPAENAESDLERASCNFAVPISVPAGHQVSVMTADWRGYADGSTKFLREYFFAGQTEGIKKESSPSGDYTESDSELTHETFSKCGEDVTLRINSSVEALTDGSYIAVDSADMQNTLVLHVEQKSCGKRALPAVFNMLL